MESVNERIIVLKTIKHGESDLIVHGLTPQGARLNLYAKGALRSRKRFGGGVLEPTHFLQISYRKRNSNGENELHILNEASLIRGFPGLRQDYDRLEVALHMVQLVHRMSREGVIDSSDMFDLLGNGLKAAETSSNLLNLRLHFEVKLLSVQGVLPPHLDVKAWLPRPIAEHDRIAIGQNQTKQLYAQVHDALRHYC